MYYRHRYTGTGTGTGTGGTGPWQASLAYLEPTCVLWTPKTDNRFSRKSTNAANFANFGVRADCRETLCQLFDPIERS